MSRIEECKMHIDSSRHSFLRRVRSALTVVFFASVLAGTAMAWRMSAPGAKVTDIDASDPVAIIAIVAIIIAVFAMVGLELVNRSMAALKRSVDSPAL